MSRKLEEYSQEELDEAERRAAGGYRSILLEQARRKLSKGCRIEPELAIPEKGAAESLQK